MTAIQFILIAIAAFIVLAGLFMVIRSLKRRKNTEAAAVNYDKMVFPLSHVMSATSSISQILTIPSLARPLLAPIVII